VIAKPAPENSPPGWKERIAGKVAEWSPQSDVARGIRSPHFWIITALIAIIVFLYYVEQTPLVGVSPFDIPFFTGVHDLQRTLFLIPVIYAAIIFRVRGSLIASLVFLCVVLPRALLFSAYPVSLLRPILFVIAAALASLLIATQLNRAESERKARAELSTAYQQLRETQEQLIQAEKLTSLGQLAASIAHEVNNPISGVLVYTQLLAKKLTADTLTKEKALDYLSKMGSELTRTGQLIRNLLDFARQTKPTLRLVNINEIIDRASSLVAHSAELQHVEIVRNLSVTLPEVTADPDQLQQVFTNLMVNAIQAMPQGGKLSIRTAADNSQVKIEVQDTGVGISQENMRKLFTPFFTTRREVKGVGLGLAVSYGIIQHHQGRIEVQSEEGEGTTFTIYLPLHREEKG